jgi:signal transduction histidine kinase
MGHTMGSTDIDINEPNKADDEMLPAQLPDQIRAFCNSGKSVAQLAHLAKNIIQMVTGSVEIMELGLERKQYDRVLRSWDIFESNFYRLTKFVLDLIKYTKHYPLQKTQCDLSQLVQNGIHSCENLLKNKHVKIRLLQDKTIPKVWVDADRFEEIVVNLIIHAYDNFGPQAGTVTIQTHYLADEQQIQLDVSDDAPALSEDIRQQLTEPFERTRNMTGTGFEIPLALCYVQQHNGTFQISGNESTGNSVCVSLPIK